MSKLFWEDFHPGRVFEHGPHLVTREDIIAFAAEFDPQPMHLDEAAARRSMTGGLCASGWQACCILMRMCADAFVVNSSSMGAPGVDEVRWLLPIRPNDQLRLRATVLAAYRWQYIISGVREPRFSDLLGQMITAAQAERIGQALAPILGAQLN